MSGPDDFRTLVGVEQLRDALFVRGLRVNVHSDLARRERGLRLLGVAALTHLRIIARNNALDHRVRTLSGAELETDLETRLEIGDIHVALVSGSTVEHDFVARPQQIEHGRVVFVRGESAGQLEIRPARGNQNAAPREVILRVDRNSLSKTVVAIQQADSVPVRAKRRASLRNSSVKGTDVDIRAFPDLRIARVSRHGDTSFQAPSRGTLICAVNDAIGAKLSESRVTISPVFGRAGKAKSAVRARCAKRLAVVGSAAHAVTRTVARCRVATPPPARQ